MNSKTTSILGLFVALIALYVVFPDVALGFALVIAVILIGYGFQNKKFSL